MQGTRSSLRTAAAVVALLAGSAATPALADSAVQIREGNVSDINTWGFTPPTVSLPAGQAVTWTNSGTLAHSATATSGQFDTGLLPPGESKTITLSSPGTYDYQCTPHPWMKGSIVVTAGAAAPAAAAPAPAAAPVTAPPAAAAAAPVAQAQPTPTPFRFVSTTTTSPSTSSATPPRAGGLPLDLALPLLAGGASAFSGGLYLLRRGRRRE